MARILPERATVVREIAQWGYREVEIAPRN